MSLKLYFLILSFTAIASQQISNEPNFKAIQSHYLDFPLTKKDFESWKTVGSALFLKNRAVLSPESKDKKGILYSVEPNPNQDAWMADIELNIGNEKQTYRGGTGVAIFYLKNVDKVSHKESIFGYSNRFEGLGIYLNTILRNELNDNEIAHAIQGYYSDGEKSVNIFSDKSHICFRKYRNLPEDQYFKIRIQYDKPLVTVQFYNIYTNQFQFCFSLEADLSYNGYLLLSSSSGVQYPDHIYLKSVKLYDTKTVATNEHFQEARQAKAQFEEMQRNVQQGVKDLFENKSNEDLNTSSKNLTELFELIPQQHQSLQHSLQRVIEEQDQNEEKYFNMMRALPQTTTYNNLLERVFNFKIVLNQLSADIEKQNMQLITFEKELKKVRYDNDIQTGIQRKEVSNPQTKKLLQDLIDLHTKLSFIEPLMNTYSGNINKLDEKIAQESEFTSKLEASRKKFAADQSEQLLYDMKDIDKIFDDLEKDANPSMSLSNTIINIGMIAVVFASFFIWIKLNSYESKNV